MTGSSFYTFDLVNYVDTSLEQNQTKEMDYPVVDSVGSWKQQKTMKTLNSQQRSKSNNTTLNTQYKICSELLLNTKWWTTLIIIVKFWSSSMKICVVNEKVAMRSICDLAPQLYHQFILNEMNYYSECSTDFHLWRQICSL